MVYGRPPAGAGAVLAADRSGLLVLASPSDLATRASAPGSDASRATTSASRLLAGAVVAGVLGGPALRMGCSTARESWGVGSVV